MKNAKFYWLPNCSTCIKAKRFLEDNGVEFALIHDIKTDRLSRSEVEDLAESVGGPGELFSRRAIKYREMGLNLREVPEKEMLELMTEEYTFIKRPVLIIGESAVAGFSEKIYTELVSK